MDERLRAAFGAVRAGQELREGTLAYLTRKTRGFRRARPVRRLVPALACLLLALAGLGGCKVYFTPTASITLDVNPRVELQVNRFGRVLSLQGLNADGEALEEAVQVRFLSYQEALETLLSSPAIAQCLERGEVLSIDVVGDDPRQTGRILSAAQHCAQGRGKVHCCAGDTAQARQAGQAGLSLGKYQLFLDIQALDPQFTPEQAREMTARELRDLLDGLSSGLPEPSAPDGGPQADHGGSGHGHGHGGHG